MAFSLRTLFRRDAGEESAQNAQEGDAVVGLAIESGGGSSEASPFQPGAFRGRLPTMNTSQNQGSPFQPVAEEGFTVREISILLPPQFVRANAMPADQVVPLPLNDLRATFQSGRPSLQLSQIFQACPYLFNRQVLPAEDTEVVLPYQKVRRILESLAVQDASARAVANVPVFPARQMAVPRAVEPEVALAGTDEGVPPSRGAGYSPFQISAPPGGDANMPPPAPQMNAPLPFAAAPSAATPFSLPATPAPASAPAASPFRLATPEVPPQPLPQAPPQTAPSLASPFQLASVQAREIPAAVTGGGDLPFSMNAKSPGAPAVRLPAVPAPDASSPFAVPMPGKMASPVPAAAPATPVWPTMPPVGEPRPLTPTTVPPAIPPAAGQSATPSPFQLAVPSSRHAAPEVTPPAMGRTLAVELPVLPPQQSPLGRLAEPPVAPKLEGSVSEVVTAPMSGPQFAPLPPQAPQLPPAPLTAAAAIIPTDTVQRTAPLTHVAPAAPAESVPPTASEAGELVTLSLAAVLKNVITQDLGFDPANVPDSVKVSLPISRILSQLASGRVIVPIADIALGVAEKFRPAFARSRRDLVVQVPLTEVFHNLPESAIPVAKSPAPAEEEAKSSFATPFSLKAEEDSKRLATVTSSAPSIPVVNTVLPPLLVRAANRSHTPNGSDNSELAKAPTEFPGSKPLGLAIAAGTVLQPMPAPAAGLKQAVTPQPEVHESPVVVQSVVEVNQESVPQPAGPLLGMEDDLGVPRSARELSSAPPRSFTPRQPNVSAAPATREPLPTAPILRSSTPPTSGAPSLHALGAESAPPAAPQIPEVTAAPVADSTPPATSEDLSFGWQDNPEQIALRAIFNTEETLAPASILDLSAQFPGIRSCLIITASGLTHSGKTPDDEQVKNFSHSAPEAFRYLQGLASTIGMAAEGSFTIKSDQTVRTFIIERGVCLAVLHAQPVFQPGVREKLILVTRELAKMLN